MVSVAESVAGRRYLQYNQTAAVIPANSAAAANHLRKRRRGGGDFVAFSLVGNSTGFASVFEVSVAAAWSVACFAISAASATVTRAVNWYPFRAIVTIKRASY